MSPRYEDDAPRQHDKKKIPLGLIAGCGLFAILVIGAAIWVIINLINTVGDAANPDSGTQTSVVTPSEDGADSGAIPDDGLDSTNSDDESDNSDSNNSAQLNQSNFDNDANKTNNDNVVYVTETVTAQ